MDKKEKCKQQAQYVVRKLKQIYPEAHCELHYTRPVELLVATVLSAQCTDERVNKVTKVFFSKYRVPEDVVNLDLKVIEEEIYSTGFYKNKAKNIKALCTRIVNEFGGELPNSLDQLILLPGVGRKTANVVLGEIFNKPEGVVVDTHVKRLSNRLGLTTNQHPEQIEKDLIELIPFKHWVQFSHWMIFHGRKRCKAFRPLCLDCELKRKCYYFKKNNIGKDKEGS